MRDEARRQTDRAYDIWCRSAQERRTRGCGVPSTEHADSELAAAVVCCVLVCGNRLAHLWKERVSGSLPFRQMYNLNSTFIVKVVLTATSQETSLSKLAEVSQARSLSTNSEVSLYLPIVVFYNVFHLIKLSYLVSGAFSLGRHS